MRNKGDGETLTATAKVAAILTTLSKDQCKHSGQSKTQAEATQIQTATELFGRHLASEPQITFRTSVASEHDTRAIAIKLNQHRPELHCGGEAQSLLPHSAPGKWGRSTAEK